MKWVSGLINAAVESFVAAKVPVISRVRRVKPTAGRVPKKPSPRRRSHSTGPAEGFRLLS